MPAAEIIAVGSELLTPEKTDTNSLWLTARLNELGIEVKLKTVVGDDRGRLIEAVKDAFSRSDVVITTGGLGPTEDDITRECTAAGVGRELVFVEELVEQLKVKFRSFGVEMPEKNIRQAYIIEGSEVIQNPRGSAVGMSYSEEGKILIVLPGPPREMRPMFTEAGIPLLKPLSGGNVVIRKSLRVTGFGESTLDELIAPIYTKYQNPETSTLFSRTDITVQFTATASSQNEAEEKIKLVADEVLEKLGDAVFSTDDEDMEVVVGNALTQKGLTLSVAESCTGGLVSKRLTDVAGSSGFFLESFITYSNNAKIGRLSVPEDEIVRFGAVSAEVAESMAKGARETAGSDIAVSVTGIAGPGGGTEQKPVGTVFIAFADKDKVISKHLTLPGDRNLVRWRSSQIALDLIRTNI